MANCSICELPALAAVNRALVSGAVNMTLLARKHGVSRQALLRHQAKHIPPAMLEASADGAEARVMSVLDELDVLRAHITELLATAKIKGDTRGAVVAIREGTRLVELIAKVRGDLQPVAPVQINLVQTVEFQTVAARIMGALDGHPEARARVVQALGRLN